MKFNINLKSYNHKWWHFPWVKSWGEFDGETYKVSVCNKCGGIWETYND